MFMPLVQPTVEFDLKRVVLQNDTFGPREVRQMQEAIARDFSQYAVLRDAVGELQSREEHTPASQVRLGVCLYLLGRYYRAIEVFKQADGGAMAHYLSGQVPFRPAGVRTRRSRATRPPRRPATTPASAPWAGPKRCATPATPPPRWPCSIRSPARSSRRPSTCAQRAATVAALGGNPQEVVALYERAVEADRNHPGALFGLALENDRHGNDDTAMELVQAGRRPLSRPHRLAGEPRLLYEDREQYEKAAQCYQRVLDVYPDHPRAALFFKDTEASHEQYYDEDAPKKRDRMGQVLSIPVTDFELSVRSRNCLQKMGIMTLGDLCRCTEQELLASKNFGETSLVEIKEMLATKGLRLGQYAQERPATEIFEPEIALGRRAGACWPGRSPS